MSNVSRCALMLLLAFASCKKSIEPQAVAEVGRACKIDSECQGGRCEAGGCRAFAVTPSSVVLGPKDRVLTLHVDSGTTEPVAYRVSVAGAHLKATSPTTGTISGSGDLTFAVDPTAVTAVESGAIRIVTPKGELVVSAPMQPTLSARYQGQMVYDGLPLPLGGASLTLDVHVAGTHVDAVVDDKHSLLFARSVSGDAQGSGVYSAAEDRMVLTLGHRVDAAVGGNRNLFNRPMYRKIQLILGTDKAGVLEGTFTEEVHGLFTATIRASGHVTLRTTLEPAPIIAGSGVPVDTTSGPDRNYRSPRDVFGWNGPENSCFELSRIGCEMLPATSAVSCRIDPRPFSKSLVGATSGPFLTALSAPDAAYTELAATCAGALGVTSGSGYSAANQRCGRPVPLACLLESIWNTPDESGDNRKLFADAVGRTLAPAMLVAKQDIVAAVAASFTGGVKDERSDYEAALAHLRPSALWVLQPGVIESLHELDATSARGGLVADPWGAATSLADLLSTLATIDSELTRNAAATDANALGAASRGAQERALLVYLETLAVSELVRVWHDVPPTIVSRFSGVLGPLDNGFVSLLNGDAYFGLPSDYVPFVFNPDDAGPGRSTNFEQVLARAQDQVARAREVEVEFRAEDQRYRVDASALQHEASDLKQRYDNAITAACGSSFALPSDPTANPDWSTCGSDGTGALALLRVKSQVADGQVRVLASRALGKYEQILISANTLQNVLLLREDEIAFRLSTGQTIAVMSAVQGVLHVATHAIEIASNAELWNAAVPAALAVVGAVLDAISVQIESGKDQLKLAIEAKSAYAGLEEVKLRGIEQFQREWIELQQMQLEATEAAKALAVNALEARNLLDQVKITFEDRRRAIVLHNSDPARDPSVRVLRDDAALAAISARAEAQRQLWLASRALSFEINMPLPTASGAVLSAGNALQLDGLTQCLKTIYGNYVQSYGVPQEYPTELSLRRLMGITGAITSPDGATISEAAQFAKLLIANRRADGSIVFEFATTLQQPNATVASSFFSASLCNDKLWSVSAKFDGDFLGDNRAEVDLQLSGANFMRTCLGDDISAWSIGGTSDSPSATAVIQAGVNSWGDAVKPNSSLAARAVAQAHWILTIPAGSISPDNADVLAHVENISDVWLRVVHHALPRVSTSQPVSTACLAVP